jgi:hypothetical protein
VTSKGLESDKVLAVFLRTGFRSGQVRFGLSLGLGWVEATCEE